jgi:hypothetical protein
MVQPYTGEVLAVDGSESVGRSLVSLRGRCPRCDTELCTGLLPRCPICGSRDHDVNLAGTIA